MTALRDAAERAESLAHQTATAVDAYVFLGRMGGPDDRIAGEARRCAVAAIERLAELLALLGTLPDG